MSSEGTVGLEDGVMGLYGRLSAEDRDALTTIVQAALVSTDPGHEDDVEGFTVRRRQPGLDSMSDLGSLESMRMSLHVERRAKAFETLTNINRRISTQSDIITSNLK